MERPEKDSFSPWERAMRGKHRRRHGHGFVVLSWLNWNLASLRTHPLRASLIGTLGLALAWLTLTKSLPFALAPIAPDWALALNPNNPAALIAKARQINERMLSQTGMRPNPNESGPTSQRINTLEKLPEAASEGGMDELGGERDAMRKQIRQLAIKALGTDPLNAEAYALLGMVTHEPERVRMLMQEAFNRSRRESAALLWLLNESFYRKDYRLALDYGDLLIRTRPELAHYAMSYLARTAEDAEGFPLVANALAKRPSWRGQFFDVLSRSMLQAGTPFRLMISLKAEGAPPSAKELAPYLDALINKGQADEAYSAWLQFLPEGELANLGLLTNGNFGNLPSGSPFDWRIAPGVNAVAEFVQPANVGSERLLHVSFGSGRVKFPELSQIVVLGPGHYRLEGKLRGTISAKRGLRWRLSCANGSRVLAETDMLMGETGQWRIFALEGDVPLSRDCVGQTLRLLHDSRSPSEEFISGEVWFGSLRLVRTREETKAPE
jgi:hypothetical protein